jgi:integrase
MGRKRTNPQYAWLPKRCYPHRLQVRYIAADGKATMLGPLTDPAACLKRYGEIIGAEKQRSAGTSRTVSAILDRYLLEIVPTLAPKTQEDYRDYCGNLRKFFGEMEPEKITLLHMYDYHKKRVNPRDGKPSPVRANREITVFGCIFDYAIGWSMVEPLIMQGRPVFINPTQGFKSPHKERERERNVSASERRRFARQCCPAWLRGYLALKFLTGRRQGELLKLGLFSERQSGLAFKILKKRRERELIVMWSPRLRAVWAWLKTLPRPVSSTMIFTATRGGRRGQALTPRGFKSAWQRAQAKWEALGGLSFWEHDIRAAAATAAASDVAAQTLLDHTSAAVTRRYRRGTGKVMPLR